MDFSDHLKPINDSLIGVNETLSSVLEKLRELQPEAKTKSDWAALNEQIVGLGLVTELSELIANEVRLRSLEMEINLWRKFIGEEDYATKRAYVSQWNARLRAVKGAVASPETGEACIMLAIASYDKQGRYTLESRETKKRTGSYKSLKDFAISIVPDAPRKEWLIDRRKTKDS